jgi:hypothetical protein
LRRRSGCLSAAIKGAAFRNFFASIVAACEEFGSVEGKREVLLAVQQAVAESRVNSMMLARKIAGLTLVAFAGCAQAPSLDEEAFSIGGSGEDAAAPDGGGLDAGPGGLDSDAGFDAGSQAGGGTAGASDGGGVGGFDAGLGAADSGSEAGARPADAGDAAPGRDSAAGGTTDSGPGAPDTGGGGATCNPATCNNNCLLLERCCNENNECACLTPLTQECTLESL